MPSILETLEKYKDNQKGLIDALSVDTVESRSEEDYHEEYDGVRTRRIKSVGKRENKTYTVMKENEDGSLTKTNEKKTVYVSKIIFPFPRKIVRTAVHFLFGGKMVVSAEDPAEAFDEFKRVWSDQLKMQARLKSLARTCMIETKAAVLFYPQPALEGEEKILKLRAMNLKKENGDFYPHFDDYGDMDAFIRKYTKTIEGKPVEFADIYMADKIKKLSKETGEWAAEKDVPNLFKKIPVVYVEQEEPEWESITSLIDDFEMRVSRLADTNDYFAEPLLKIFGKVKRAPTKEEVGKVLEFEMHENADGKFEHGDANYATWDSTPESMKLELETIWDGIFSMTSTPDLSFNNVKGLGAASGIALKLMFMDALIKKEEKAEIFGDALRRCISVVAAGISGYTSIKFEGDFDDNQIEVTFTDQLPDDLLEAVNTLMIATGSKPILSQESGVALSPLTKDPSQEMERLKAQKEPINESFNL
jgi:hypothetical protein